MKEINLMSDTVTQPTAGMRKAMAEAQVGDDVFGADPTINALERRMADMFGKKAAVFCPSGTMANQIAIKTHTQPMDEMICEANSHVYLYEAAGYSFHSGIGIQLLEGNNGKITASQIEEVIRKRDVHFPISKLVVLENSCNRAGGSYYRLDEIQEILALCRAKDLKLHLDGARLFNVLVETDESPFDVGQSFDSLSICLSKGLGAPVGSVLLGSQEDIIKARRYRKVMGGGMRQAGILAAAGIYALDNNIDRLKVDNNHAKRLAKCLEKCNYVESIKEVHTNIVIFNTKPSMPSNKLIDLLNQNKILALAISQNTIRLVTHLDIHVQDISRVEKVLFSF